MIQLLRLLTNLPYPAVFELHYGQVSRTVNQVHEGSQYYSVDLQPMKKFMQISIKFANWYLITKLNGGICKMVYYMTV